MCLSGTESAAASEARAWHHAYRFVAVALIDVAVCRLLLDRVRGPHNTGTIMLQGIQTVFKPFLRTWRQWLLKAVHAPA